MSAVKDDDFSDDPIGAETLAVEGFQLQRCFPFEGPQRAQIKNIP